MVKAAGNGWVFRMVGSEDAVLLSKLVACEVPSKKTKDTKPP